MPAESALAALMLAGACVYAVMGGTDFGAGVWEALSGRRFNRAEREMVYGTIGPVWEANHVWLIFVLVLAFSAFPPVFAGLSRALWLPLLLALAGMVLRGSAYGFRSAQAPAGAGQALWRAVFAAGSVMAAFFLGTSAGAAVGGIRGIAADGSFSGGILEAWTAPHSLFSGMAALAGCAWLSATLLAAREAGRGWRRRALAAGIPFAVLAPSVAWLHSAGAGYPLVRILPVVAFVLAALSLATTFLARPRLSFLTAGLSVASLVSGVFLANHPFLLPPNLAISSVHAPESVLKAILVVVAIGAVPLLAALVILFRFSRSK